MMRSLLGLLYRGDTRINFLDYRKRWYMASAIMLLICVASITFRGFDMGIEFAGGSQFLVPVKEGTTLSHVRESVETLGVEVSSAQEKGSGAQKKYVIRTSELTDDKRVQVKKTVAESSKTTSDDIAISEVSSSWGDTVTDKALLGLVVFLGLVSIYLWIRYEQKMAIAALLALVHDLLLTAGVYSLIGFEVTPGTVIGLLTILGYSLYDTVVVFDKVDENTRGILGHNRYTYVEAANLAVNQTLMRSINTSLVALLPVGGLLFVGAGILGVGTLKDLALVLFVGMLTGAYSSLFLATPWLVDLKMVDQRYKTHAQRVLTRRVALSKGEESDKRTARLARAAKASSEASAGDTVSLDKHADDSGADSTDGATSSPGSNGKTPPSATRRPVGAGASSRVGGRSGSKKRSSRKR